jgi:hypothetical protein
MLCLANLTKSCGKQEKRGKKNEPEEIGAAIQSLSGKWSTVCLGFKA